MTLKPPPIEPILYNIGSDELDTIEQATSSMMQAVKQYVFSPEKRKKPPRYSASEVSNLCGKTYQQLYGHLRRNPAMEAMGQKTGNRMTYSLKETRQIVNSFRPLSKNRVKRPYALTIAITNFKGGVTKTTTSVTLAQGLSLRGYSVLIIDLDPQGSTTSLFGLLPDIDVTPEQTAFDLFSGKESSIQSAIQSTYWDGIDIVAASPILHSVEFILPSRQVRQPDFEFWRLLDSGLDSVRDKYDVLIIDTSPSLSYSTINGIMAADGLIIPLPPSALDFASSAQFWDLANDLVTHLFKPNNAPEKKFAFIDVLLSKVDKSIGVSNNVRQWIVGAYGSKVLPVEIPKTSTADTASTNFGTVYDLQTNASIAKTLKRAKIAYDEFVDLIDRKIQGVWLGVNNKETK